LAKHTDAATREVSRTPGGRIPGSIEIYRPLHAADIEMRVGTNITAAYPRHWHEELQLCGVTIGAGCLEYGRNSYSTPRDSLFLVPPGQVHSNRTPSEAVSFQSIYIPASRLRWAAAELVGSNDRVPDFRVGMLADLRTRRRYLQLHRALRTSSSRLRNESLVLCFMVNLIVRHSMLPASLPYLGRVRGAVELLQEFLTENYAQAVSLQELARLVGLSPFHIHRMFSRATGMPPHAYQMQVRITRARSLLLRNRRIADVALATGFADQSHFTRHFKRLIGVTPAQYLGHSKNVLDTFTKPG